ncbi:sulfatase [bacterium]|nr:sulfatase [bacterium]
MNRRAFVRALGGAAAAAGLGACSGRGPVRRAPNIVFILVDDMGWRDAGFMGSRFYETPHMDRLASEGVVFSDAYASAPNCAPSRASLLTGLYTPRHGIYTVAPSARGLSRHRGLIPVETKSVLDPSFTTIAEVLRENGYTTASMGKWHLGDDPASGPVSQGFDVHIGGYHGGHPASYFSPYGNPALEDGPDGEYLTDRLTREAVRFITENRNRPFFLYLPHYAVHTPLQAKEPMISKYEHKTAENGQQNPTYAAMVESTDQGVGEILRTLDDLNLTGKTIVILFSDNGGLKSVTDNSPLRGGKGMLYEGGIRVPMVMRCPGRIPAGRRCSCPVTGVDFFPTILELAGVHPTAAGNRDGESLVELVSGSQRLNRNGIYWHFPAYLEGNPRNGAGVRDPLFRTRPAGAVRSGGWKLIEFFEDGAVELYNLENDLGETRDLSETCPAKAAELHRLLQDWRKRTNAPVPAVPNPEYRDR